MQQLPNETLWAIASYLTCQRDVYSLIRTNRHTYIALKEFLYRFNSQYHHASALPFATKLRNSSQVQSLLDGLQIARGKTRMPPSPRNAPRVEDEEDCIEICGEDKDATLDPFWADIFTHSLFQERYSILDIENIQSALSVAIRCVYTDIVMLLLNRGANVNFYRGDSRIQGPSPECAYTRWRYWEIDPPPLFIAVQFGHREIVRLLLERGANAELYVPSPLYRAVDDGRRDIISVLVEYGAGPQTTALILAVLRKDISMVRYLLDGGFKIEEYGHTGLYAAKIKGDQGIVYLLLERGATLDLLTEADKEKWEKEDGDGRHTIRKHPIFLCTGDIMVSESDFEEES